MSKYYGEDCWDRENPWFLEESDSFFQNHVLEEVFPLFYYVFCTRKHQHQKKEMSLKEHMEHFLSDRFGLTVSETTACMQHVMLVLAKDKVFSERFGWDCWKQDILQFTLKKSDSVYHTFVLPEAFKWLISRLRAQEGELDMQGTVKGEIKEALRATYQMQEEDASACIEFALQELNQNNSIDEHGGLKRKDGQSIKVSECWKTDRDEYADGELFRLQQEVESKALEWVFLHIAPKRCIRDFRKNIVSD